jgi:uncharacterized protein (DUF488 family)
VAATVYTIGHGALQARELLSLLRRARIARLVDVRAFPSSRRHPQFSKEQIAAALASECIVYDWQGAALGGFRKARERSAHSALRNPMFRGYAEHMESKAFVEAARTLADRAQTQRICVMCAESDPERCHRSLISDWLVAHGHRVIHLLHDAHAREHALSPLAVVEEARLVYRGVQGKLL